jgi:hypothetical protein
VLRRPNLDVIFSYRGGARSGTYLEGLRAVGATRVGHVTVAGFLQTWAPTGGLQGSVGDGMWPNGCGVLRRWPGR